MNSLRELYASHDGKLSDRWTLYLETYQRLLESRRDANLRMLEIGIQNGGSLEIWSKYFPHAQCLIGCDIDPKCELLQYDDPRVSVVVADANTDSAQARIRSISPELDLIIDDGSHTSSDIVRSFARYFPMLVDGGLFIAEDLHCSYWAHFEGGLFDPTSSMAFFKALADVINFEHWGRPYPRTTVLAAFNKRWGISFEEDELARVHSIEFVNSVCIVRKAEPARNVLGPRVVTRGEEVVAKGHHELVGSPAPHFEQAQNPRSALDAEPFGLAERLAVTLSDQAAQAEEATHRLNVLAAELVSTKNQLKHATDVIEAMRASHSWRYTSWLRSLSSHVRREPNA